MSCQRTLVSRRDSNREQQPGDYIRNPYPLYANEMRIARYNIYICIYTGFSFLKNLFLTRTENRNLNECRIALLLEESTKDVSSSISGKIRKLNWTRFIISMLWIIQELILQKEFRFAGNQIKTQHRHLNFISWMQLSAFIPSYNSSAKGNWVNGRRRLMTELYALLVGQAAMGCNTK